MKKVYTYLFIIFFVLIPFNGIKAKDNIAKHHTKKTNVQEIKSPFKVNRFKKKSDLYFKYPDAVRGIYVTGPSVRDEKFAELLHLVETTELNAMVIDVKEDYGKLTFKPIEGYTEYEDIAENYIENPKELLKQLEKREIYPIARIVVFKDTVLAEKKPKLSFTEDGEVWKNKGNEAFVNPFEKEVWDYNVKIAKMAAELGFQEIQFDYVRFPEGFETRDKKLNYTLGNYKNSNLDPIKRRVEAVTDFVAYAKEQLENYEVEISVDIFGYAATIPETPGIGQNFSKISENVDVISSMIYPSHWTSYFGIEKPDEEPYRLVTEYAKVENDVLDRLEKRPRQRPWLQDFSAPWLYPKGQVKKYGVNEVEAQIKALNENGIDEFLLWNAANNYTKNVNYTPLK